MPRRPLLPTRFPTLLAGALWTTFLCLAPQLAQASSCCAGPASLSPGVLTDCERWGMGAGFQWKERLGTFNSDGDFNPASSPHHQILLEARLLVRPVDPLQFGMSLPFGINWIGAGLEQEMGGGWGDLSLWVRGDSGERPGYPPLKPGVPRLLPSLTLTLPSGTPPQVDGSHPARVTGTVHASLSPSLGLEGRFSRMALGVQGGAIFPLPGANPDSLPGVGYTLGLQAYWYPTPWGSFGVSGGGRGTSPGWKEGSPVGHSSFEPWVRIQGTLRPTPSTRLVLVVESSLPIPQVAWNREASLTVGLSLLRTFTR